MSKRGLIARRAQTSARAAGGSRQRRTATSGRSNLQALRALGARAKLTVSQPADPEEQEADRAAEAFAAGQAVLRSCGGGCADEETIQRSARGPAPRTLSLPGRALVRGGGDALPVATRQRYEHFFRAELSAVRVHTGARASRVADYLGARAFTVGPDIVFGRQQFAPHTAEGSRLLAHELTHVVQRGGGAADVKPTPADVLADGGLSPKDLETIRAFLAEDQPAKRSAPLVEVRRPFRFGQPTAQTTGWQPSPTFTAGFKENPLQLHDPAGTSQPAVSDICPSCHKTPAEQRAERAREQAEIWAENARREEKRIEEERRQAWPGMHRAQHEEDLGQLPESLREDVVSSALAAAQLRVQMFDAVLAQQGIGIRFGSPASRITPELRDAWAAAHQAAAVLEALLKASTTEIPPEIIDPVRSVFASYYAALTDVFRELDREEDELQRELTAAQPLPSSGPRPCPVSCHEPNAPPARPSALSALDFQRTERVAHLSEWISRNTGAASRNDWRGVVSDYRWSVEQIDALLRSQLTRDKKDRDLVEQFDFTQALLERQQDFLDKNPEALKVQAVFYPKEDVVDRPDEKGVTRPVARGIPWQFYLTRTPVTDDRYVPAGYEWQLHDITAPKRPGKDGRTVKTRYQITVLEALARERGPWSHQLPIRLMDPPRKLFEELNHRDFFPEGMLYWKYPLSGDTGRLEMTDDTPFGEWLQWIGMAIAVVGMLVFAPLSVPGLIAVGAGTAVSLTGRALRLEEKERHGVRTAEDDRQFLWDLSLDLVNGLTLGLGRVAAVSVEAGNMLRAARATRYYFIARRTEIAREAVNLGLVTSDLLAQYRAIQDSNMSPEEKSAALRRLLTSGLLTGGLAILTLRGAAHDLGPNARLRVDVDPSRPGRLVAEIEPARRLAAADGPQGGPRPRKDAVPLSEIRFVDPLTKQSHVITVLSDGRITRCSPPPCVQMAQSVAARLSEVSNRMLSISTHLPALEDLAARTRQLRDDAAALGEAPPGHLTNIRSEMLVLRARALDDEVSALNKRVSEENEVAETLGRDEARRKYSEYNDAYLDYNPEHYRWVFRKDTGLQFERRHWAVPWMEFKDGTFVVKKSLFEAVDPERLEEVRAGSVTNQPGFKIVAETDNVVDLHRWRPFSADSKRRPKGWVLVKINDDNLINFADEAIPHGTIFEFPNGARMWRTAENTIATDAPVRPPIGRRGGEKGVPAERDPGDPTDLGVPSREITGVEHQRSHPRGSGTGFEMFHHIPLAPTYVNQVLQARGIELYIAELNVALKKVRPNIDLRFHTEHALFESTRRQAWIDYHLYVVVEGKPQRLFTVRIGTDYIDPLKPGQVEFRHFTSDPAALTILDLPDMRVARQNLEKKIRDAMERRLKRKK